MCVFGHSSGAVLAMEASAAFHGIRKLAVYEPPFIIDDSRPPVTQDVVEQLAGSGIRRKPPLQPSQRGCPNTKS